MTVPDAFDGAEARIIDRGYRSYEGARTGTRGAMGAVVTHSLQRALGLRRTLWAKVFPFATVLISYLPAIVFIGVIALFPAERSGVQTDQFVAPSDLLPSYGDYYGYVITAIMLFVALVAPEVLCTDRRTGMLGVYLASPLNRDTYLLAKAAAIGAALALVCIGPTLLLLVANILQSNGPEGVGEIAETLARVVGAGVAITLLYTGVTMGVSSITDRKWIGSAGVIILFLVSLMVVGTLIGAGLGDEVSVGSVTLLSLELAKRAHGEQGDVMPGASSALVWGAWFAWTAGGFALARFQLRRLPVTR